MGERTDLLVLAPAGALQDALNRARDFAEQARAPATLRAYGADLRDFDRWCRDRNLVARPATAQTVAAYIADLADRLRPSSIRRRLAAIAVAHRAAGYDDPTAHGAVRSVWSGIRRSKGVAPTQKAALTTSELRRMVESQDNSLRGLRDRAILLLGFAAALRRSELVGLNSEDLTFVSEGVLVLLRRTKTDQEGEGRTVAVPFGSNPRTCPVRTLRQWFTAAGIASGPLFRPIDRHGRMAAQRLSGYAVALIVKRSAKSIGLDVESYAGHSLRSGFCTAAAEAGASERAIMDQSGHKSLVVARRYIRRGSLWKNHPNVALGL